MRLLQLAAMEAQLRKAFTGQTNVGIALVVAEQYVVARLVRLDEIVFEQQRFALGTSHGGFDARDLADHHGGARMMVGFLEVTRYAFLQVARLAHIQSLAGRVQHPVNTRTVGQRREHLLCVEALGSLRRVGFGCCHGYQNVMRLTTHLYHAAGATAFVIRFAR